MHRLVINPLKRKLIGMFFQISIQTPLLQLPVGIVISTLECLDKGPIRTF